MSKRIEIDKDLFSNIEISDETKRELYRNCVKGKRAGDLRFRYSGVLTAMIVTAAVSSFGISTGAYYESVRSRMENMSQEEHDQVLTDLNNDIGVRISDSWNRPLSDSEMSRLAKLERKYYNESFFPEGEVARVEAKADWDGSTLCYVEEDDLLYLPNAEMTDAQLLEFIDYNAKKDYVMEEQAEVIFQDPEYDDYVNPYVDVESATEQDIIDIGYTYLQRQFDVDLSAQWTAEVSAFKPSAVDPEYGTYHDMYTITWTLGGETPNGQRYVVVLGMQDLGFRVAAIEGREYWANLGSMSREEAYRKAEEDQAKVLEEIRKFYINPAEPDTVSIDAVDAYGNENDTRQVYYAFLFGNMEVSVTWNLADETMSSFAIYDYSLE